MRRIVFFLLFCFSLNVFAQFSDVIEIEREGRSDAETTADARKEIVDSVVENVAAEHIIEMIGREKYEKNNRLIKTKILREAGRFIPVIKNGELKSQDGSSVMKVQLKLSPKNLKSILLEYGLLYSKEGKPVICPFIQVNDRIHNMNYKWWSQEPSNDVEILRSFTRKAEKSVEERLSAHGFFGALPTESGFWSMLPEALQHEFPSEKSYDLFSSFFSYDIYLDGYIVIEPDAVKTDSYRVRLKWIAKYQGTHRVIAEVSRDYVTEQGPFDLVVAEVLSANLNSASEDLTVQLLESWQKGTFGAALYTVVLRGPMSYSQLDSFKQQLLANAKHIKSVRERRFESGQITLEADVTGNPAELGAILQKSEIEGLQVQISEIGPTRAVVDLIAPRAGL